MILPGPQSYCKCESLCSPLTVEHVIPKSLIKSLGVARGHANDLHNIYPCCQKLNSDKGSMLFAKDFLFGCDASNHVGALSRACLYMHDKYDLPIDKKTVAIWRELDKMYVPQEFEIIRNEIIYEATG
ncbi:MAG: hypothetical protein ACFFKA_19015, partial [Candidatus Thorarchaeota archaeon]